MIEIGKLYKVNGKTHSTSSGLYPATNTIGSLQWAPVSNQVWTTPATHTITVAPQTGTLTTSTITTTATSTAPYYTVGYPNTTATTGILNYNYSQHQNNQPYTTSLYGHGISPVGTYGSKISEFGTVSLKFIENEKIVLVVGKNEPNVVSGDVMVDCLIDDELFSIKESDLVSL